MEIGQSSLHQSSISSRKHLKNSIYSLIRKVRRFSRVSVVGISPVCDWDMDVDRPLYVGAPARGRGLSSGLKSQLLTASWGVTAFVATKLSSMADQSGLICLLWDKQVRNKTHHFILEMKRKYSKRKTQPVDKLGCKKRPEGNLFRISSEHYGQGNGPV